MAKKHTYHRRLIERVSKRADKIASAKKYKPRKHAFALWELAMVQTLVLERLGVWK